MVAECQGAGAGAGGGDFLIKLFGKTIPVPESGDAKDLQQSSSGSSSSTEQDLQQQHQENAHPDTPDLSPQAEVVDAEDPTKSSPETTTHHHQKPGVGEQREKLKKPDKVLACPRCNSMDTKFCYFNNYNVNQPRHFCKNCQRYWTAGGAMRNVPVGAGRRKNKNAVAAASHFLLHHRVRAAACDTLGKTTSGGGTVLSFGSHGHGAGAPPPAPACLDLAEQLSHHLAPPAARNTGNPGPCSEGSSNRDDYSNMTNNGDRSSVDEAAAAANGVDESVQHPASMSTVWPPYGCAPSPAAAYFSSGIAIPIYPAAAGQGYWGCMVPAGAWSLPWPPVQSQSQPTTTTTMNAPSVSSSGAAAAESESHTPGRLGKHHRDDDDGRNRNAKVWAPKTIRIDDVDEVARSSIWSLIGIKQGDKKQDAADADAGGQTTKPQQIGTVFEPKQSEAAAKKKAAGAMMMTSSPLLHANPVALTRSVAFQEGS